MSSGTEAGDDRGAPRPRRDRPPEDREVRRLLPRPHRRPAGGGGQRRRHPRPARLGGRHRGHRGRHRSSCPTTTTRRSTRCSRSTAPSSRRCWWSRWPPTWAWSRPSPGFLDGLRRRCTDAGALLVFDEVITGFRARPRRRAGPLRRHPRPHDVRQGDRRRAPPRRARRPRRRDGRARPARSRVPGRHPLGEPARHRRRARRPRAARRRRLRRPRGARHAASPTASATRSARRGRQGDRHPGRHAHRRVLLADARSPTTWRPRRPTTTATRASSTRCSTPSRACSSPRAATRRCS